MGSWEDVLFRVVFVGLAIASGAYAYLQWQELRTEPSGKKRGFLIVGILADIGLSVGLVVQAFR